MIMIEVKFANLLLIVYAKPYVDKTMHRTEILNEMVAYFFFISIQSFRGDLISVEN